jgi:hypothetical protein
MSWSGLFPDSGATTPAQAGQFRLRLPQYRDIGKGMSSF